MPDVRAMWRSRLFNAIGGAGYDFGIEHEWLARPAGRALWGTDAVLMFDAMKVVGEVPDGTTILDVPCGGGVVLKQLRPEQKLRYVAADISTAMLDRTKKLAAHLELGPVELVEADIEALPFPDDEFDLVVSFNGLHCMPDPAAAVQEITRVLKPGGRLVGDCVISGTGRRSDLAVRAMQAAGVFGPGGNFGDVQDWIVSAGLQLERLGRSGAIAHFDAVNKG